MAVCLPNDEAAKEQTGKCSVDFYVIFNLSIPFQQHTMDIFAAAYGFLNFNYKRQKQYDDAFSKDVWKYSLRYFNHLRILMRWSWVLVLSKAVNKSLLTGTDHLLHSFLQYFHSKVKVRNFVHDPSVLRFYATVTKFSIVDS